jgi:hypothetical protein
MGIVLQGFNQNFEMMGFDSASAGSGHDVRHVGEHLYNFKST